MIDPTTAYPADRVDLANTSGVSWAAIFGGALGAAALSLILILLGAGLGFTAASPWADRGASAQALGISAILWLTLTQIVASGLGGYIAGRLRVRWANVHDDEVYFRDTAHGFLAWSVATLITASLVLGSVGSLVGSGVQAGAQVASGVVNAAGSAVSSAVSRSDGNALEYYVDTLFRSNQAMPTSDADMRGEALRIFTTGTLSGQGLDPADRQYLGQVIAQRTGMTQPEAERRVDETYARAIQALQQAETKVKAAADSAKKVAAWSALWMFVALLCGAFVASLAATFGGKQRDQVHYTRSLA